MEHPVAGPGARTRRRSAAPSPVREVARAARLSLRRLAEAVLAGQPRPERPRDQAALLRWLGQSVRSEYPDAAPDEQAGIMADRLQEMADGGDETATAMFKAEVDEVVLKLARIELAVSAGGEQWAPHPPAVPKQQRMDAIASTVLTVTGWTSVTSTTVEAVYRWLFGDEALYVTSMELRVGAGPRFLESPGLREVRVPHPESGEMVLVTRQEIREHGEADHGVLEAAHRYTERQMQWHSRLIRALRSYGDDSTSVGDALRRAAADLGIEAAGRGFEAVAELVVAAAEAKQTAAGRPGGDR